MAIQKNINFVKYPGTIINDVYKFPVLYSKKVTTSGAKSERYWSIMVKLVLKRVRDVKRQMNEWTPSKVTSVPIIEESFLKSSDMHDRDNVLSQIWTEYGQIGGKVTISAPTYISYKNEGKTNYRNPLQTGLIYARNQWMKKKRAGFRVKGDISKKEITALDDVYMFPMNLHKYEKYGHRFTFPAAVQIKYDGMRCVSTYSEKYAKVIMFSRNKKEIMGKSTLKGLMRISLKKYNDSKLGEFYVDGELFIPDKTLQEISKHVRTENDAPNLHYYLFDCFYENASDMIFEERFKILEKFVKDVNSSKIKLVKYKLMEEKEIPEELKKVSGKYEGLVVRNLNSKYDTSKTQQYRTKGALKYKPRYSREFEVVGFKCGTGNYRDSIIFVLQTASKHKFNAVPKGLSMKDRKNLFKKMMPGNKHKCNHVYGKDDSPAFKDKFYKKKLTIEYSYISEKGIPQQPVILYYDKKTTSAHAKAL